MSHHFCSLRIKTLNRMENSGMILAKREHSGVASSRVINLLRHRRAMRESLQNNFWITSFMMAQQSRFTVAKICEIILITSHCGNYLCQCTWGMGLLHNVYVWLFILSYLHGSLVVCGLQFGKPELKLFVSTIGSQPFNLIAVWLILYSLQASVLEDAGLSFKMCRPRFRPLSRDLVWLIKT